MSTDNRVHGVSDANRGTFRSAALPVDHLIAEMTAYPLASAAAFSEAVTEIDAEMSGQTSRLWRAAESELIKTTPNVALDELVSIRDRLWFANASRPNKSVPMHVYLQEVAKSNLKTLGPVATPDVTESGTDRTAARSRQAWRWVSFALPPDLLLAATRLSGAGVPQELEQLTPKLRRKLQDHGFAETHLHIGAGLGFPLLWVTTQSFLASGDANPEAFASPGGAFDDGRQLADWLLRASIARYLLACFLKRNSGEPNQFEEWFEQCARPRLINSLGTTPNTVLVIGLRELLQGQLSSTANPIFADLRAVWASLSQLGTQPFPDSLEKVKLADPIAGMHRPGVGSNQCSETSFVRDGLHHLKKTEKNPDREFETLFWQVVRVRAIYYRHIVQRPMTPGLAWFVRTYERINPGRRLISARATVESCAETCGWGQGLKSLEVRCGPNRSSSSFFDWIRTCDHAFSNIPALPGTDDCEFGFVVHLIKQRGGGFDSGRPYPNWSNSHADPKHGKNVKHFRFAHFFEQRRLETVALAKSLFAFPGLLRVIRGFDVCSDESGVPTWVIKPLFRYLRDTGHCVASVQKQAGVDSRTPRFTAHTGEDYVHLLTGIRAVADVIDRFELAEGDRIGHAVALGVDAKAWAANAGRVPVPLENRLFDLAWEWKCYTRHNVDFHSARRAFIEDEIERISAFMFGRELQARPTDIVDLIDDLHDERKLGDIGFPSTDPPEINNPRDRRLLDYLTRSDVFQRGQQIEWVIPTYEASALETLQRQVRQRVASLGLTIEINPSSNLLIGNLGDLERHPFWRMRSPNGDEGPRLRLCIGSDDPLTFNTTLMEEYQLVHDALVLSGQSSDDADTWIEHLRQSGLESRFTLPRNVEEKQDFEHGPIGIDRLVTPILYS